MGRPAPVISRVATLLNRSYNPRYPFLAGHFFRGPISPFITIGSGPILWVHLSILPVGSKIRGPIRIICGLKIFTVTLIPQQHQTVKLNLQHGPRDDCYKWGGVISGVTTLLTTGHESQVDQHFPRIGRIVRTIRIHIICKFKHIYGCFQK